MFTVFGVNFEFVASAFGFTPNLIPKGLLSKSIGEVWCNTDSFGLSPL